jgi:hypothetical protein
MCLSKTPTVSVLKSRLVCHVYIPFPAPRKASQLVLELLRHWVAQSPIDLNKGSLEHHRSPSRRATIALPHPILSPCAVPDDHMTTFY